jgi:alpha-D-xyloside xylohydrolase
VHWDDGAKTLTVGAREGSFPGLLTERTFRVVVVGSGHGVGIEESEKAEAEIKYKGEKLAVTP